MLSGWDDLESALVECRACPRLAEWREAVPPRASYADEQYWARPVPGFGDRAAPLVVVGLAPGAHGANRTGRMFTGDRSGDWLYAALHRAGVASQADSSRRGDGLTLHGCRITAAVHCVPPDNRPTPAERDACGFWLDAELALLAPTMRALLVLGGFAWDATLRSLGRLGWHVPRPRPLFGHGAEVRLDPGAPDAPGAGEVGPEPGWPAPAGRHPVTLVGSYHVSQQNTFTGRLTAPMLDEVVSAALRATRLAPAGLVGSRDSGFGMM